MKLSEGLANLIEGLEESKRGVIWDYRCRPEYELVIDSYRKQAIRMGKSSIVGDDAFALFEPIQGFVGDVSIHSKRIDVGYSLDSDLNPKKICELTPEEKSLVDRASSGFIDEISVASFIQSGIRNTTVNTQFLVSLRNLIKITLGILQNDDLD